MVACGGWETEAAMEEMMEEWSQGRALAGAWNRRDGGVEVSKGGSLDISTAREEDTSIWMLLQQGMRGGPSCRQREGKAGAGSYIWPLWYKSTSS